MNHYERLKVSPDAPPEVIRAAYRALATKLHPDRQGGNSGPNEEAHEAMSALNASYLVLTNEKARQNYDAQLRAQREGQSRPATGAFQTSAFRTSAFQATGGGGPQTQGGGAATDAPDIDWLRGKQQNHAVKTPIPHWAWALLVSALATAAVMGWMVWHGHQRSGVDALMMQATAPQASRVASGVVLTPGDVSAMLPGVDPKLAEQIANAAAETGVDTSAATSASAAQSVAASTPTLVSEELDKLSNDELLARTQQILGGQTPQGMAGAKASKATLATAATNAMASADMAMAQPKRESSRLLEGAQGLSLKISPSARMGSVPSSQP